MKCLTAVALWLALAATCVGAELQNLDAAAFKPGELKVPLTVVERSGVARKGVVVTGGVPFPAGFLSDVRKLCVLDAAGEPVPCQATVMTRWWKPRYDNSVRWALLSFQADVAANGKATYFLTDTGAKSPQTKMKVTKLASGYQVGNGRLECTVGGKGDALIRTLSIDGKPVIGGDGLRGVLTSGTWKEQGLKGGELLTATYDPATIAIEESGPVRVVVAIKGTYKPGAPKSGKHYDFTCRLYVTADSPSVRVIYTIRNGKLDPKLIDGKRRVYTWPIEDASLVADLAVGESVKVTCLAEGELVSADELAVYQDSSGGKKWKDLAGGNYENWLAKHTKGREVPGVTFRGYKVTAAGKQLTSGNSNPGVLAVAGKAAGLAAALRNFRVEYPSALTGSAKELRVGLFPDEFAAPFWLEPGQRKSWDIRLTAFTDAAPQLKDLHAEQDALLLFRVQPAWVVRANAWTTPLPLAAAPRRLGGARWDRGKLDGVNVGWDWYGWISSWNAGGGHWNQSTCFAKWVLWGDGKELDVAEAKTLWSADVTPMHWDDPDLGVFWMLLRPWNWREPRVAREQFPGFYSRAVWGRPDTGHMAMFMWQEYYYLTGDMRAREACISLGQLARARLWEYNHDDRGDGTGPMPRAVNWCRKRDPDAEPKFRPATRYVGWPLYDLACWYELTGDPKIAAECKTVALGFRNTARMSPIGFMVTQINAKDDGSVYGRQGPFDRMRAKSASQCYAHFQEGIMTTGLAKYYEETGDVEALDTLIGFGDLMSHHAMLRDPTGKRIGWTYSFGDYWGPYKYDDLPPGGKGASFFVSNFRVTQPLGKIYQATGRADYLAVLTDAVASRRGTDLITAAAYHAVSHPHVDGTPPAAVTDLAAKAIGRGKVALTWTAPGDDGAQGAAAWYQVKCTTAEKLVERVTGWPDLSEPLPTTKAQWHERAEAFNDRQRAFWAAENVDGEPTPAQAGSKETFTLTGLAPGTYQFALKTWDDGPNISAISNVVAVEVK